MLTFEQVHVRFGGVRAVEDVSFEVGAGELLAVIGPNGAGKTTLLNAVSGVHHPASGHILFDGRDITHLAPHRLARLGIARTFQNIGLFPGMTVLDNVLLGRHVLMRSGVLRCAAYWGLAQAEDVRHRKVAEDLIDFLEIEPVRKAMVGVLPYGLQKRVELARALALEPRLLLLDEPMGGMNLDEKEDMARFVLDVSEEMGVTIILVEHDMGVVMDLSDRVVVLDHGRKIAEATPAEVQEDPVVIRAYLGRSRAGAKG